MKKQEITAGMSKAEKQAWEIEQRFLEWSRKRGNEDSSREEFDLRSHQKAAKNLVRQNKKEVRMQKFQEIVKEKMLVELNMSYEDGDGTCPFDESSLDQVEVRRRAQQLLKEENIQIAEQAREKNRLKDEERQARLRDRAERCKRAIENDRELREQHRRNMDRYDRESQELRNKQQRAQTQMEGLTENFGELNFPRDGEQEG